MDWATRKVLSWRGSNPTDVEFCLEALEEALDQHGRPDIFNTDQRGQLTSPRLTGVLLAAGGKDTDLDGRAWAVDGQCVH